MLKKRVCINCPRGCEIVVDTDNRTVTGNFCPRGKEYGISEDCKDEIIKLVDSIEYDPSFEYGYDLEQLQIDLVNILVKHGNLPEECYGMTIDEIPAGITINEF